MEQQPLPEPSPPGPAVDGSVEPEEHPGAVHLARFNVVEVEDIERALAEHLGVDPHRVAPDGFLVVPEADDRMRITWESSALIDVAEFQALVERATGADPRSPLRPRLPEPHGPIARPRRKFPRRSRRARGEDAAPD